MPTTVTTTNHSPITISVLRDTRFSNSGKIIILYLADHLPQVIQANPLELQQGCGLCYPTISQSLDHLRELGLVERLTVPHAKYRGRWAFKYRLSLTYAAELLGRPAPPVEPPSSEYFLAASR